HPELTLRRALPGVKATMCHEGGCRPSHRPPQRARTRRGAEKTVKGVRAMDLPGIVVMGAAGRMGRLLLAEVLACPQLRLAGAVVRPGHAWVGQDLGTAMGRAPLGLAATDDAIEAI